MNEPDISKLPKWARERIQTLERDLEIANSTCKRLAGEQKPSPFYINEWYSEPPIKRYVDSPTGRISIDYANVHAEILLAPKDDGQRLHGIEITYSNDRRLGGNNVAIIPRSLSNIQLVSKENMR